MKKGRANVEDDVPRCTGEAPSARHRRRHPRRGDRAGGGDSRGHRGVRTRAVALEDALDRSTSPSRCRSRRATGWARRSSRRSGSPRPNASIARISRATRTTAGRWSGCSRLSKGRERVRAKWTKICARAGRAQIFGSALRGSDDVNSQLPTPNSQGEPLEQWGESRANSWLEDFHPIVRRGFPWELGVGSWELINPRAVRALSEHRVGERCSRRELCSRLSRRDSPVAIRLRASSSAPCRCLAPARPFSRTA